MVRIAFRRMLAPLNSLAGVAISIAATTMVCAPAQAQGTGLPSTVTGPVIYRLAPNATLQRGCFPPCLCPIWFQGQVRGTFVLTPIASSTANIFDYRVDEVNWLAATGNLEWRITGAGILRRIASPAVGLQRLELDLRINDEPVEHFDSGWILPTAVFPNINLPVSIHGAVCLDTQITVIASPVPASQLVRYHTQGGSSFQQGCFPPCLCPIQAPRPIRGSFTLVPLSSNTTPTLVPNEYAMVQVRLNVISPTAIIVGPSLTGPHYRGYGIYRRNLPTPTGTTPNGQRMFLDLRTSNTAAAEHFDSGVVLTPRAFPAIDITMSINGMVCFDKVIHLRARPVTVATP